MTATPSGSPIGSNISGRKTPEFPTSTHLCSPVIRNKKQFVNKRSAVRKISAIVPCPTFRTPFYADVLYYYALGNGSITIANKALK